MVVPWPEKLGHYQFKKYGEFVDRVLERLSKKIQNCLSKN